MSSTQLIQRPYETDKRHRPGSGRAALRKARVSRARKNALLARYLGYVGYFVGAGLISGAVVHHPLDPARYTRIAGYGVLVFLAATLLNEYILAEKKPALPRMLQVMGASLLLSFGIGMLSGGLQHFEDFPDRAALLVPLGVTVSFVAYVLKDAESTWRRIFSLAGLTALIVVIVSFVGLRYVASTMAVPADGGGHSHGSGEERTEEGHDEKMPENAGPSAGAPEPTSAATDAGQPEAPGRDDGHSH
ncbi:hypothetical protein NLX86_23090 [Streptomyces sp. A3M-1-3]|uniref:hypothetical protein n=1 Tax=Streptomyces sp. A3M-1-3 TaxID=2962044 RepID=UPI0020B6FC12|nr:hypothetical protein [Streptomyces sp. A3M-1-3]MCP3820873.1 hypothetical protein [Streptomyces sp. A3M-1-3]